MNKRDLQKIETRKKIFNASIELFSKNGYDNISIEKICSHCNIAKGTFYVHFKSKSEILVEKYSELDVIYIQRYEEIQQMNIDILSKFKLYVKAIFETVQDCFGTEMIQVLYIHHLKQLDYEILINKNRFFYTGIESLFEQLIEEYNLNYDSKFLCDLLLSSVRGNIFDWAISGGEIDMVKNGSKRLDEILNLIVK